jgi:hypothetical protein
MEQPDPAIRAYWKDFAVAALKGPVEFRRFLNELKGEYAGVVVSVLVENTRSEPIELALEPLGVFYQVPPGVTYELLYLGSGEPELEETEAGLSNWDILSWNYGLFQDGVALETWPAYANPQPEPQSQ